MCSLTQGTRSGLGIWGLGALLLCFVLDFGLRTLDLGIRGAGGPFRTSDSQTLDWSAAASHTSRTRTSDFGTRDLGLQTLARLGIPDFGLGTRTSRPSHLAHGAPTGLGTSALDLGLAQEAWSVQSDCGLGTRTVISASRDLPGDRTNDVSR